MYCIRYCTKVSVQEMIKIVRNKVQTSLWLDRDVKRLIEDEGINLSKYVNESIGKSLCVDTENEILGKIKEHERGIGTLRTRLKDIQEMRKGKSKEDQLTGGALEELRSAFSLREEQGRSREENLGWILSPKNVGRCKILGKTTEEVLNELEAWYDGVQKSNVKEN